MEQVLRSRGEEPMEVGSVDTTGKLLSVMESMQRRLEQVNSRVANMEGKTKAPPPATKPQEGQSKKPIPRKKNVRPDHRWTEKGEPICNLCYKPGHLYRECPARTRTGPSTSMFRNPKSGGQ